MSFEVEPTGYEKTVLSELQGAWQNLRDEVAERAGFPATRARKAFLKLREEETRCSAWQLSQRTRRKPATPTASRPCEFVLRFR